MKSRDFLFLVAFAVLLSGVGCSLPQWRVFQKSVPAATSIAPTESDKRAASYIAKRSAPPVADSARAVQDIHEVATGLSASLGAPAKPVRVEDLAAIIAAQDAAALAKDKKIAAQQDWFRKYGGTPLEGTGINLAGPAGLVGLVLVIAACIACPALGYLVLRMLPVLWGYFRSTTSAVAEFAHEYPDAGDALKETLSKKMDAAHKRLVRLRAKSAVTSALV